MPELNVTLRAETARQLARELAAALDSAGAAAGRLERGTGRATERLSRFDSVAGSAIRSLRGIAAAAGVSIAGGTVLRLADSYTTLQNRLRVVTSDQESLNAVFVQLVRNAAATRSSLEGSVTLYSRLADQGARLGLTQGELVETTRLIGQSFVLSGATASELAGGLTQLSQGFNKGRLDGDELRSVLENNRVAASVLADELGVTAGQLRDLGQEGRITSEVIINAFRTAGDRLDAAFKNTLPTLGQAFQVVRDRITIVIGRLDDASGVSSTLAQAMLYLSGATDTVSGAAAGLVTVLGYVAVALGTIVAIQTAQALIGVTRSVLGLTLSLIQLTPAALRAAAGLGTAGAAAGTAFASYNFGRTLADQYEGVQLVLNEIAFQFLFTVETVREAWRIGMESLPTILKAVGADVLRTLADIVDRFLNITRGLPPTVVQQLENIPVVGGLFSASRTVSRDLSFGLRTGAAALAPGQSELQDVAQELSRIREETRRTLDSLIEADRSDVEAILARFREGAGDGDRQTVSLLEAFQDRLAGGLNAAGDFASAQVDKVEALIEKLRTIVQDPTTAEELEALLARRPGGLFSGGPGAGAVDKDSAAAVEKQLFVLDTIEKAAQGAGRALGNMFTGVIRGTEDFREAGLRVSETITDIIVQALILRAIGGFGTGGDAGTGALGAIQKFFASRNGNAFVNGGVRYFGTGGTTSGLTPFFFGNNQAGIAGEAGTEGILPLRRNPATGNLGVEAVGEGRRGGGNTYILQVVTPDVEGFSRSQRQVARAHRRIIERS